MSRRLVLASASPRRRELLEQAGFAPTVLECDLDDAHCRRGAATTIEFITALSWFKAARVLALHAPRDAVVLAADTVCLDGEEILGKPRDAEHARKMLRSLRGREHRTVTGVTLAAPDGSRRLFADLARVTVGALDDRAIDDYVASGAWQGKAGGYNYAERIAAGWPIRCAGDPTGVMGLPMQRTVPLLGALGVVPTRTAR